jgi:hypothetical protein
MPAGLVGSLLGLGNPLLDISAVVDQAFLDKYDVSYHGGGLFQPGTLAVVHDGRSGGCAKMRLWSS